MAEGFITRNNGTIQIVNELPENPSSNNLYIYNSEKLGLILALYDGKKWKYSPMTAFPNEIFISVEQIFSEGFLYSITPESNVFLEDIDPITFDDFVATKALRIFGNEVHSSVQGWNFNFTPKENSTQAYLYLGVEGEGDFDYGTIVINGNEVNYKSGGSLKNFKVPFSLINNDINNFSFRFSKDHSGSVGKDSLFIYGIKYSYI